KIPVITINWNKLETVPRLSAGASSARYVGINADAAPTAIPKIILEITSVQNSGENADPSAPTKKIIDDRINSFFRPNLSEDGPIMAAPRIAPINTALTTQPCCQEFSAICF